MVLTLQICQMLSQYNKKLMTIDDNGTFKMKCNKCDAVYRADAVDNYMRAIVMVSTDTGNKKYTMFSPTIKKLFASRDWTCEFFSDMISKDQPQTLL